MSLQRPQRALVVFVILSLLLSTGAGGASANRLATIEVASSSPTMVGDVEDDTEDEEDSGGGWFSNVVDSGKNIAGAATDGVVDGAGAVWNAVEPAPGAVRNVVQQAPGAIGDAVTGTWQRLREVGSKSIEVGVWADFLDDHPRIGFVLGPIVYFILGLSPDGTISFFEIGIGLVVLTIPVLKGGQALTRKLLPWADDAGSAAKVVRRNPGGIINGVADMILYRRAKVIAPIAKGFSGLPDGPGVYVALDTHGKPVYVGMSGSLRNRVPQHFGLPPSGFAPSTDSIKIMPTSSSVEARALECRLIKSFRPEFNVVHMNNKPCPSYAEASSFPIAWRMTPIQP